MLGSSQNWAGDVSEGSDDYQNGSDMLLKGGRGVYSISIWMSTITLVENFGN